MTGINRHEVRRYATDAKLDGERVTVYCYSCTPCNKHGVTFATRSARDRAIEVHTGEKKS